jgi:hypothetical protein
VANAASGGRWFGTKFVLKAAAAPPPGPRSTAWHAGEVSIGVELSQAEAAAVLGVAVPTA